MNIPFLAVNRGHGSTTTLGKLRSGIEIHISVFDKIVIAKDGNSAVLGGGVYTAELVSTMWSNGKASGK